MSILNYPEDIYGLVRRGRVEVVRKDVTGLGLGGKSVVFEDGMVVEVDPVVCSTGWEWKAGVGFLPRESHAELGLQSSEYTPSQRELWAGLEGRADREILARFPTLRDGSKPIENNKEKEKEKDRDSKVMMGWRLWRGITPPSLSKPPDIVFLGMILQLQSALRSEMNNLWAYAYLYGKLREPLKSLAEPSRGFNSSMRPEEEKLYDTTLFNRFGRRRTPYGMGGRYPDVTFDGITYFDLLLRDLGLRNWRKGWGWVGEVFGGGYAQAEYRGLVEEWMNLQGTDG